MTFSEGEAQHILHLSIVLYARIRIGNMVAHSQEMYKEIYESIIAKRNWDDVCHVAKPTVIEKVSTMMFKRN